MSMYGNGVPATDRSIVGTRYVLLLTTHSLLGAQISHTTCVAQVRQREGGGVSLIHVFWFERKAIRTSNNTRYEAKFLCDGA